MDMSLPMTVSSGSQSEDKVKEADKQEVSGRPQLKPPINQDTDEGPPSKKLKQDPAVSNAEVDPLSKLLESPGNNSNSKTISPVRTKQPPSLPKLNIDHSNSASEASPGGSTPLLDTPTTPHPGAAAQERIKKEQLQEEREKMQLLVSSFTEDQLDRYAMYRRAALPKATIKILCKLSLVAVLDTM